MRNLQILQQIYREMSYNDITEWAQNKRNIRTDINSYVYEKIKRRPMVVPVIVEI